MQGNNKTGWQIAFDWFINKSNFLKVLEGNYDDKENENTGSKNFGKGVTQKSERPKVTAEGLKKYFGGTN